MDDFEKALDSELKAMPLRENAEHYCTRDEPECLTPRQKSFDEGYIFGARWAREWLKSQYPFLYRYLNERQKLRAENEQLQKRAALLDAMVDASEGLAVKQYKKLKAQADKLAEALEKISDCSVDVGGDCSGINFCRRCLVIAEVALAEYRNNGGEYE